MHEHPAPGEFYLHQDGGLYQVLTVAKNAEDLSGSVVYKHLWPFEVGVWHRPLQEWFSRFKLISEREAAKMQSQDRAQGALRVAQAKAARREKQTRPA